MDYLIRQEVVMVKRMREVEESRRSRKQVAFDPGAPISESELKSLTYHDIRAIFDEQERYKILSALDQIHTISELRSDVKGGVVLIGEELLGRLMREAIASMGQKHRLEMVDLTEYAWIGSEKKAGQLAKAYVGPIVASEIRNLLANIQDPEQRKAVKYRGKPAEEVLTSLVTSSYLNHKEIKKLIESSDYSPFLAASHLVAIIDDIKGLVSQRLTAFLEKGEDMNFEVDETLKKEIERLIISRAVHIRATAEEKIRERNILFAQAEMEPNVQKQIASLQEQMASLQKRMDALSEK